MEALLFIFLLVVNIPVYKVIFRLLFDSMEEFYESVRYSFTPDMISLFRGDYVQDWFGEWKLTILILMCIGVTFLEFKMIMKLISYIHI